MMVAGIALTVVGLLAAVGGTALAFSQAGSVTGELASIGPIAVGGSLFLTGVPLLAAGAVATDARSPALVTGGAFLIGFGAASLGASVPVAADAGMGDAVPLLVNGAVCLAGGIAMVVLGSRKTPLPMVSPLVTPRLSAPTDMSPRGTAIPVGLSVGGVF
jgi:hypothetical protein